MMLAVSGLHTVSEIPGSSSVDRHIMMWISKMDVDANSPRLSAASITPSLYLSPRTEVPVTSGCLYVSGRSQQLKKGLL